MIISKKKYQEALLKASCEAEARTAIRYQQEKRREEDERGRRYEIEQLYKNIDELRRDLSTSMMDLARRVNRMDHQDDVVQVCNCQRGRHEQI